MAPDEGDFFDRTRWGWHALFAAVAALAASFLAVDGAAAWIPLLVALVAAYVAAFVWPGGGCWAAGRLPARWDAALRLAYLAVAYTVVGILAWVDPNTLVLLFILFPQTFLTLDLRWAVAATFLLTAIYTLVLLARSHWSAQALRLEGVGGVVTAVFAIAVGAFITGLVHQGEQRRRLIDELTAAQSERDEAQRAADVAAERERLAREIHDTLAQDFTSVVMLAQAARAALAGGDQGAADRRLGQIDDAAREGLAEARALVAAMQPAALDGRSLDDALRRLVTRFEAETGVRTTFRAGGHPPGGRSAGEDVVLLRAAQEALANVARHAGATTVEVRLAGEPGGTTLAVSDDGRGFDPGAPAAGYGLEGMRARATEAGGGVEVVTGPAGTTVRVTVARHPAATTAP